MTQCWWIRHAPIAQTGCYTGHSDVDAIIPVRLAAFSLPDKDALWLVSPLKRSVQTARWLMQSEERLQLVPALKEQNFGEWEGRSYDDVWKETQHQHDWSRPETIRPAGGESFTDVCERVDGWMDSILTAHKDRTIIMVAHAGVIRAGVRHALRLAPSQALALQVDYSSVTQLTYHDDGVMLHYLNRHL